MKRNARSRTAQHVFALTVTSLLAAACIGRSAGLGGVDQDDDASDEPDGGTSSASTAPGDDGAGGDDGGAPVCVRVGESPGRALDRVRWQNTVADLFGVDIEIDAFPGAAHGTAYPRIVPSPSLAPHYEGAAEMVAEIVNVDALLACSGTVTGPQADSCIETLATSLGRRAWRRPLTADEIADLVALDQAQPADERARAVVRALLSSEAFWVLDESGAADPQDAAVIVLNDHALATRLAYFLWNGPPDATLLDLADAGELADPGVRLAEVDRMLSDGRAARAIADYWEAVLETTDLESQAKDFPEHDASLAQAMREELRQFVADVVLTEGDWGTLLSAPRSYQNAQLASVVYEGDIVGPTPGSTTHVPVQLDPARRPGVLTRAATMTRWSGPGAVGLVSRALLVRERLFCHMVPIPPDDLETPLPETLDMTRIEALAMNLDVGPNCRACHLLMEPITAGFDNYDPMGRWQTALTATGAPAGGLAPSYPVDSSGFVAFGDDAPFDDRDGLLTLLTEHAEVRSCLVRGHLEFALGRPVAAPTDACTIEQMEAAFDASDANLRQLLEDIVASEAFTKARHAS